MKFLGRCTRLGSALFGPMQDFDAIIIGAGAAGMFAAAEAGRRSRRVLVIEHMHKVGEKIRISGGGRCNFTNLSVNQDRFLSRNPRFALSALKRYGPQDFVSRLTSSGVEWEERQHGQLFCKGAASQINDMLLSDMKHGGVELWLGCQVTAVSRLSNGFRLVTDRGDVSAQRLVVATGGKSIPKIGATGFGYQLAAQFGLSVVETRPGLVPLTFSEADLGWIGPLAGIGVPGRIRLGRTAFDEAMLFTHRGLSGPAILQISSYWREGSSIIVDFFPNGDLGAELEAAKRDNGRQMLRTALGNRLPERLARHFEQALGETRPLAELASKRLVEAARLVQALELHPIGTEGYRTAEVTLGGVDTQALDSRTMEARDVPGLHFIGEVVDVTGWLGGYNFQWAWSSGWAVGQVL